MDGATSSQDVPRHATGECKFINGRWTCWPTDVDAIPADVDDREFDIYELASEHFRHDLTQFWNHSSFFALLQGGLISVAVTSLGPQSEKQIPGTFSAEQMATAIGLVGMALSVFWAVVSWRRSALIQQWRQQVLHLDGRVNRHAMYLRVEPNVATYWWYGPTKLTRGLPFLVAAVWLALLSALVCSCLFVAVLVLEALILLLIVAWSWKVVHQRRKVPSNSS